MSLRKFVPCLPEPNHLQLILGCYPKSKSARDPDSNALGKLTFYTKSRPVKLAKVGRALLKRSQRGSESENRLCITLAILKRLLDESRSDIAVFSNEAMAIIELGLQRSGARNIELLEKTTGAVSISFYYLNREVD